MRPRRASPKPVVVVMFALVLGTALVLAARPSRAAIPVDGQAIERVLEAIASAPSGGEAHARFLMVLTALDALPVTRQAAWLDRLGALGRRAPLIVARARFERWASAATGAELGLVRDATVTAGAEPAEAVVVGPRGALALDSWLHPASGRDVAHVAFGLCVASREALVLRLGASGDVQVVVDERMVGAADDLAKATLDQIEIPIVLEAGAHRVVVSVRASGREPATLRARVTDRIGHARPDVPCAAPPSPATSGTSYMIDGDGDRPELLAPAWARTLGVTWRPLAMRLLGWPVAAGTLGGIIEADGARLGPTLTTIAIYMLGTPEARSTIVQNLPADLVRSLAGDLALVEASLAADRGQLVRARARLASPPEARADDVVRRLVMARILREEGDPAGALVLLSMAADASEAVLVERARAALAAERPDLARAALDALGAASPERIDLHVMRTRALLASGLPSEAIATHAALARARPDRPVLALEAAERALFARDTATARALVDLARPLIQWKPDALVAAARIEAALGDEAAGRALAARALALEPAHEEARLWLEATAGTEPAPLTIVADAELAAAPAIDPEAPWEVMAEELVIRVADDGSATKWMRRILRAQHPPSAREDRTFSWRFDPSQESVRVLDARVLMPDGHVVYARERNVRTAAEDWYNLYFDVRVLEIPFDRLIAGALVEVTLRIDTVGQHFPGVFELVEVLRDRVPKHRHRVVVEAPTKLALRSGIARQPQGAAITEAREPMDGGRERIVLDARHLPALPREPLAPGAAEVSPTWQVTSFATWPEVARWYDRLLASQVVVTADMRQRVAEIVQRERGDATRVTAALVALVQQEIRYVGLEFGIHGYKPYRTDEVWARRFGDCKDQALLLTTLLGEAGIAAEVALVRTRGQGRMAGALPSLAIFDHAIVYLPERGQYVDSTVVHHGMGELPAADQGAQVLSVTDDAGLATTSVDPPTRNQIIGVYSVTLDGEGATRGAGGIQGTVAFHGAQAPPYRALLVDPATQLERLQALLNRRYPGLVLEAARISDPEDVERPVELVFHANVPRLASVIGDTLHVIRPAGIDGQAERVASSPARSQPVVLGPPMTFDLTFRYVVPAGYRVRELPPGGQSGGEDAGPFGRWSVRWSSEPGLVTVRTELVWATDQVAVADYAALRTFIRAFDQAVAPALVLERSAP